MHRDQSLFPLRIDGHYTPEAYNLMAEAINDRLVNDGFFTVKFKKMKKNCIFLLLDSITYDVLNADETAHNLFPNLYFTAKKYNFQKCVSNSNCTQFVLPSLFSFTLPLDDGGYDYGIKNKKISFMEILKKGRILNSNI